MSVDDIKDQLFRMEHKLDRIDERQDSQDQKLGSMDVTIAKQEKEIAIHIEGVRTLKERMDPLEKHVIVMQAAWKVLIAIGAIAAMMLTFKNLLGG